MKGNGINMNAAIGALGRALSYFCTANPAFQPAKVPRIFFLNLKNSIVLILKEDAI